MRRTIKVAAAPQILDFPHAVQVAQLRRTRTINATKSVELVYVITSMTAVQASPTQIATWIQGHWGIESKLHWVRDVVYDEDHSTVRTANAPRVMATLRSTAISLIPPDRDQRHRPDHPTSRQRSHQTCETTPHLLKHDFDKPLPLGAVVEVQGSVSAVSSCPGHASPSHHCCANFSEGQECAISRSLTPKRRAGQAWIGVDTSGPVI